MLNNNKANVAISFLLALIMWAYVIGEVNPVITETFHDIPIELVNVDKLNARELSISSQSSQTIDVTISASKSIIDSLKSEDIKPYVDVAGLEAGTSQTTIIIPLDSEIELIQTSIQSLYLTVETTLYDQKTVDINFSQLSDGTEESEGKVPYATSISKDTVGIYGAESIVNSVEKVIALVDTSTLTDQEQEVTPVLSAVNANGEVVNYVQFSEDITIDAMYYYEKTVPLRIDVINPQTEGIERTVDIPRNVSLLGPNEVISDISSIRANQIDLTEVTRSMSIEIVPILPTGVALQFPLSIDVTVNTTNEEDNEDSLGPDTVTEVFNLSTENIDLLNLSPQFRAVISAATLEISVTAPQSVLDEFTIEDIVASVDLTGLTEGTHTVNITLSSNKETESIISNLPNVEIEITLI